MFKGKYANSHMQHPLCCPTQIPTNPVGQPQLQVFSCSCLQLPHSSVCSLPGHPASSDRRMLMYEAPAPSTNSAQLCRAIPVSELPWSRLKLCCSYISAWLLPLLSPASPYRCGFQSSLPSTACIVSLPLSLLPKNLVCNTKHIRISVKITSPNEVQIHKVKSENNFLLYENVLFFSRGFISVGKPIP